MLAGLLAHVSERLRCARQFRRGIDEGERLSIRHEDAVRAVFDVQPRGGVIIGDDGQSACLIDRKSVV